MAHLAVSSFSLHTQLGPLSIDRRDEDGTLGTMCIDFPKSLSLEAFAAQARDRIGINAVELCQIQFESASDNRIAQMRAHLDALGVAVLTVPIDIGDLSQPNGAWRDEDERRIADWFTIAKTLGAQYVRVNAGVPGSGVGSDAWDGLVAALRRLGDRTAATGMRLLVENHGGTSSSPEFLRALIDAVGRDRLGLLLDIGNFEPLVSLSQARFFDPGVPDAGLDLEPLYAAIAQLAPMADLVHAKSVDPAHDGTPLPDLERALSIVARSGYAGSIAIEWEGRTGDPWEHVAAMASEGRRHFPALA